MGGVSSSQVFFWILGILLTLQSPLCRYHDQSALDIINIGKIIVVCQLYEIAQTILRSCVKCFVHKN